MRILPSIGAVVLAAGQAAADDMALMVGLRNAMAVAIRDHGHRCPEVLDYEAREFVGEGRVLKVVCGNPGGTPPTAPLVFRLMAYPDGDFTARPWRESSADLR